MEPCVETTAPPGRWPVLDLGPSDADEVRALFAEVFGQPMSAALWHWKYGDGRGLATGMRDAAGRLVAHYGATLREVQDGTRRLTAVHIGDVMVSPLVRDVFARMGPFGRVSSEFVRRFVGPGRLYPLGYGFPNDRHMRLGKLLDLYWPVAPVWEFRARLGDCSSSAGMEVTRWDGFADWAARANCAGLFEAHASIRSSMGSVYPTRSMAWWTHRYLNHPHHVHRVVVWQSRRGRGMFVVRVVSGEPPVFELLDWVADAEAAEGDVLDAVCRFLTLEGRSPESEVCGWCTPQVADAMELSSRGVDLQRVCDVGFLARGWSERDARAAGARLWLTGGDTDFR